MKAAVLREYGGPLSLADLTLDPPRQHEVRVRVTATAVCRSDAHCRAGNFPVYPLPLVPGHEAAGVVTEPGPGVTRFRAGDHVVITWNSSCGTCWHCRHDEPIYCLGIRHRYGRQHDGTTRLRLDGQDIFAGMDAGTFLEEGVFHENALVPVPADLPAAEAALLGCTIATGVGAALHTGQVSPGDRVVVIGCGAVGLSVIQGCRIAGAERIIAIDMALDRLVLADEMGATHLVPGGPDAAGEVADLTDGVGADRVFEAVGSDQTIRTGLDLTRRGGAMVLIGSTPAYQPMDFYPGMLTLAGKSLLGCCYGSVAPSKAVPALVEHWQKGELRLGTLITSTCGLDQADQAVHDVERGHGLRTVICP